LKLNESTHLSSEDQLSAAVMLCSIRIAVGNYAVAAQLANNAATDIGGKGQQLGALKTSLAVCQLNLGETDKAKSNANEVLLMNRIGRTTKLRCKSVLAVCMAREGDIETASKLIVDSFSAIMEQSEELPFHQRWCTVEACRRVVMVYELADDKNNISSWKIRLAELQEELGVRSRLPRIGTGK
jgi:hypothetical protein